MIRKAAIKTKGGFEHSSMDTDGWRSIQITLVIQMWIWENQQQILSRISTQKKYHPFRLKYLLHADSSFLTDL